MIFIPLSFSLSSDWKEEPTLLRWERMNAALFTDSPKCPPLSRRNLRGGGWGEEDQTFVVFLSWQPTFPSVFPPKAQSWQLPVPVHTSLPGSKPCRQRVFLRVKGNWPFIARWPTWKQKCSFPSGYPSCQSEWKALNPTATGVAWGLGPGSCWNLPWPARRGSSSGKAQPGSLSSRWLAFRKPSHHPWKAFFLLHVFPLPWVSSNYHSHTLFAAVLHGWQTFLLYCSARTTTMKTTR